MKTDREICREIAAQVEDGTLEDAVTILENEIPMQVDLNTQDENQVKPRFELFDQEPIPQLVVRAIHTLIRARREFSACILLPTIATPPERYADLITLLQQLMTLDSEETRC